jgi:hypothetical protein
MLDVLVVRPSRSSQRVSRGGLRLYRRHAGVKIIGRCGLIELIVD